MKQPELRFANRVVIITGAGAGLGRAYALLFASRGASVVVNDLGGSRHGDGSSTKIADAVVNEIRKNGGKAVANYDSVLDGEKIVKTAIDAFGRIDVIVNNAGILRDKSFSKMSETDWDLVQNVHVKGAFKITRAAWPYFVKQKYGRIIVTTSNSGLYGNFGQANYSAAKMGLIGLANTLAIEGESKNIHTNIIIPTAASRLTEDVLPPEIFEQLKPELIAPVVVWLCHEKCMENGSIIESALGWAGKCKHRRNYTDYGENKLYFSHVIRSSGSVLRPDLSSNVTPEDVEKKWSAITDMSTAKHFNSIAEVTGEFLVTIDAMKSGNFDSQCHLGASVQMPTDFRYLYENDSNFAVLPTFFTTHNSLLMDLSILEKALPSGELNPMKILHGEQYLEIYKELPTEATIETRMQIVDVLDKGSGAVFVVENETFDTSNGDKLCTTQMILFAVGAGGFQGKRSSSKIIPTVEAPNRQPDASVTQQTSHDQAALYRLSGDKNPLHIDSNVAMIAGFKKPILHGLCSLGFSVRHVLQTYANGDPSSFKAVKARFAKPVIPGQSLQTNMWQEGNRIHFQTSTVEENLSVLTGGYVDLKRTTPTQLTVNHLSGSNPVESDAVFATIGEYVKANLEQVKKINGVFLYHILVKGKPQATWTLDLKKGELYKGEPKSGKPDATLTLENEDMVQMALGKLNPQTAFMRGKLKVGGNLVLMQKLATLMEASRSKL
ncbi:Peroxisomal multifunctional enzyme type 2 [Melipona quadrifasciata]|uniref:Peroxisomal multifunctional enzyme type 2 n=1 Tax=Melipona quadrifasciata TaxID=166423 RepID=A0A0N0U600_9HYME|nr:Peroxisomal multifunctional enzyme type 2 [Melipona quadrifasciata]